MATATMEKPKTKAVGKKDTDKPQRYRLLRGRHIQKEKGVSVAYQVERDKVTKAPICPVLESDKDLCKLFNAPGKAPKFEKVGDTQIEITDPMTRLPGETIQAYMSRLAELQTQIKEQLESRLLELDNMDKEALEEFAQNEEIDLGDAKSLKDIRKVIRNALTTQVVEGESE